MIKSTKILWICAILMLIPIIVWGYTAIPQAYSAEKNIISYYHQGWCQILDGVEIPLDDIQDFTPVETGESLIFTCTLPDLSDGDVLLLYSSNQEVRAYVDGVMIQDFTIQDNFTFLKTPGSAWNQIDLTEDMSGCTLQLELTGYISPYNNYVSNIFLTNQNSVENARMTQTWFLIAFTVSVGVLAILAYINLAIWKKKSRREYFFYFGNFYLAITLWLLSHLHVYELITHRPLVGYLLEMFFIRCIPLMLYYLLSINYREFPYLVKLMGCMSWLNLFISFFLQFILQYSLLESLWINHLIFFLNIILYFIVLIYKLQSHKSTLTEERPFLFTGILFAGMTIDCICFSLEIEIPNLRVGMTTLIGCYLYTIISYIVMRKQDSTLRAQVRELENSNQKLQTASLMQQIKAHFIFNTLNTISSLCKYDAAAANHAIIRFSTYMRGYMYLINTTETIPFAKELSLIHAYLDIEKLRFGEKFNFTLDIQYDDFLIPPLSLQPIVENAMIHGLYTIKENGELIISTNRNNDNIEIVISDNGVGFDTTILDNNETTGVGFNNLRKRIEIMSNGSINVTSQINVGTTIRISLPVSNDLFTS